MPRSTRTTGGRYPSLTASVTEYPTENGRTYHRYHEGSYVYPNDEREMDRLDMQHHICKMLTGERLFFAPLINPRTVLDIGTGSGIWPIELASIFPHAQITGTDLSPCQPNEVPVNVHFIVDDITEDEWLWDHNSLDYIHAGHLSGSLPSYKELIRKTYSHLKPGGWAEIHEFDTMVKCDDGTMPPLDESSFSTYPFQDWCDLQIQSGHRSEPLRQFRVAHRLARGMRELGFVDVQERIFKAPVNPWPTDPHLCEIGKWMEANILEGLSGWSYKPLMTLGWSKAEIEVFLVNVRKSVQNCHVHAYLNFHVILYAYRHAAAPASTPFIDHVWISEELLTSTFRRFVNGQRRYESRVPGPLEARRRLAKRRNTALASVAGSGPMDDIACLFGRNGREHMKWSELGGRSLDYQFASPNPPAAPVSFYNENLNAFELQNPLQGWSGVRDRDRHRDGTEKLTRDQFFGEQLREYRTAGALKDAIRELDIDLRQEPSYSRLIFDHLISQSVRAKANVHELALFLDDPQLNIPGAGNYLGVVEHYVSRGIRLSKRHALFDTVIRALELGIVPPKEIDAIVNGLSELGRTDKGVKRQDEKLQTQLYRRMWDAIGKCGIYGHQDLDEPIVDNWLGVLLEKDTVDDFLLAKDILLATNYDMPTNSLWLSKFVTRWLYDPVHSLSKFDGKHVIEFLKPFNADLISKSVIGVTEALFTSGKTHLLKRWGSCLARLHDTPAITSSHAWTHIRVNHDGTSHRAPMSPRHQIIQRLWILYTMNKGVSGSSLPAPESSVPNPTIKNLYRLYESARRDGNEDLWSSLTKGIHDLNIPFDLQAMADDLRTGKSITDATRRTLQKYETSPLSFAEIFADLHTFNAAGPIFFHNIEKMVRRIDIASPSFRKHATHTARTGDTHQVWTLIRLLRLHTPLKLALSKSWHPIDPADKALVRDDPNPRPALHPDPHAALDLIHALAAAFACSDQLSPRRAFELVRWLYVFVYRHGAPVRPPLARSLYHAGVDRFRREKSHVSMTQYEYILNIVEQVEGPEVVDALKSRSFEDPEDFEDYD
ncbi:hypothetical protein BJX76DRAFT_344981 [Aspergillus varians]